MASLEGGRPGKGATEAAPTRRDVLALAALGLAAGAPAAALGAVSGDQLTWGLHVSLSPTWFDPAETLGIVTPFMVLYALHDAVVKPMPGSSHEPCLAQSWSASEDGLTYEFVLRQGAKFHNGEPVTAEDVKFSFERYHGASHDLMKERVAAVEAPDPQHVRFKLKGPWPDFLTFYSNASGAGWIVPKKYVEKVGDGGFKNAPVGAGPYKFVSFDPGVELVLEAFEGYWRKPPNVKRLVMKVIPDEATRLAALKRGEIDIAYSIRAELAEELRRTTWAQLKAGRRAGPKLAILPRPMGPEIAVARSARTPGGQPRARPRRNERGVVPRLLQDHQQHHTRQLRVLLAATACRLRSHEGQAVADRSRLSRWVRWRSFLL